MKLANLIDQLAEISSSQWGLFTTSQAKANGVTPQQLARLANLGRTERIRHGIYLMEGTRVDRFTPLRAAWLAMEPSLPVVERLKLEDPGIFCGRSAAYLHGLGKATVNDLELAFGTRKQSCQRDVTYRLRKYTSRDWMLIGGLPTTKPLVTLRDHATGHVDHAIMLDVLRSARSHPRINAAKLKSIAETYCKYYGFSNGAEFILAANESTETQIEHSDHHHVANQQNLDVAKRFTMSEDSSEPGKSEIKNSPPSTPAHERISVPVGGASAYLGAKAESKPAGASKESSAVVAPAVTSRGLSEDAALTEPNGQGDLGFQATGARIFEAHTLAQVNRIPQPRVEAGSTTRLESEPTPKAEPLSGSGAESTSESASKSQADSTANKIRSFFGFGRKN